MSPCLYAPFAVPSRYTEDLEDAVPKKWPPVDVAAIRVSERERERRGGYGNANRGRLPKLSLSLSQNSAKINENIVTTGKLNTLRRTRDEILRSASRLCALPLPPPPPLPPRPSSTIPITIPKLNTIQMDNSDDAVLGESFKETKETMFFSKHRNNK